MSQSQQMIFLKLLSRLEKVQEDLQKSHQSLQESEKIKFLQEIIKEQIRNEEEKSSHNPIC
jgi:hypothetical protein